MKRYQLAKLVEWAGTLDTRKRMQKVVYLLQAAGCRLEADYFLHRFGPYSQDVARLTDEMVAMDLLRETEQPNAMGRQFAYELTDEGAERILSMDVRRQLRFPPSDNWNSPLRLSLSLELLPGSDN